ncbi:hypothetical protein CEQ90_09275 [Lewinellaceae bacterium SD302]|nr:hypothetical protein CEQ90_09275 [Lewinellaceae bacterium SD302]
MYKFFATVLLAVLSFQLCAQEPFLVADFNPGEGDALSEFNAGGIRFGDAIILPLNRPDIGEEPGILVNDQLFLLKNINPGEEDASPNNFVAFGEEIYFAVENDGTGSAIWKTNGTTEGTQLVFRDETSSNQAGELIVSENGSLYFSLLNTIYRFDGENIDTVFQGGRLITTSEQQGKTYCRYNGEIAFTAPLSGQDDGFNLYVTNGDTVMQLGNSVFTETGFADVFGLSSVSGGLLFGLDAPFQDEANGTYRYDENSQNIQKITVDGGDASRLHEFNGEQALFLNGSSGEGFYATDGTPQGSVQLYQLMESSGLTQGTGVTRAIFNEEKMLFFVNEGVFGDHLLVLTDGTETGTSQVLDTDRFLSNIIIAGQTAFVADGTANGREPSFYTVNMETGETDNFYTSPLTSFQPRTIIMVGVIDNVLYFQSLLDASVGRELYGIELDIDVATNEQPENASYQLDLFDQSFQLSSKEDLSFQASLLSVDGRLLRTFSGRTNGSYPLGIPKRNEVKVLVIDLGGQIITRRFMH